MTSTELQQKIDTTMAEITGKHERLNAIPEEKRRVLHDEKRLVLLEKEALLHFEWVKTESQSSIILVK